MLVNNFWGPYTPVNTVDMVGVLINKSLFSGKGYHCPDVIYSLCADLGGKEEKSIILIPVVSHLILLEEKTK